MESKVVLSGALAVASMAVLVFSSPAIDDGSHCMDVCLADTEISITLRSIAKLLSANKNSSVYGSNLGKAFGLKRRKKTPNFYRHRPKNRTKLIHSNLHLNKCNAKSGCINKLSLMQTES
ncbi:hypothetical protein NC653_028716 [Populus alba x Populus x berolinensis]|uniref:Uncharacterized protein n=1 Tax=Populus alba x Populus x berolinensis TaxID=444605 RepID=A0AAD6M369_9ROSI|nr:hypothetical protein NC653_028716 [Populus alba x Populus x berolinensis]